MKSISEQIKELRPKVSDETFNDIVFDAIDEEDILLGLQLELGIIEVEDDPSEGSW